jgi:DNA-binding HxlR family transcriptional regulator
MQGTKKDRERAQVYDALGHRLRIAILKSLSEGPLGFAELKRSVNIGSGGQLTHHLNKLNDLIRTDQDGKYCLSDKGKEALLTMQPIEKYTEDARFQEQVGLLIRALRSDTESVHEIAIAQISLLGPKAISFVRSALSEALAELREGSRGDYGSNPERAVVGLTRVLGIMSVPGTVDAIAQALPVPEAFEALAKIGNKHALEVIISSMNDCSLSSIRNRLEHREYDTWVGKYEEEKREEENSFLRKIFSFFDEEGRRALESALTTESSEEKNVIARILGVVGDDKSILALTTVLEKGDFSTKTEAAIALRRLNASEAVPKMVNEIIKAESFLSAPRETRMEEKEYYKVREAQKALGDAVLELGSINDWVAVAFSACRNSRFPRKEEFDKAIIGSKDKAVPVLTALLQAPDPEVQREAAEMITKIKSGGRI